MGCVGPDFLRPILHNWIGKEMAKKNMLKKRVFAFTVDFYIITFLYKGLMAIYVSFLQKSLFFLPLAVKKALLINLAPIEFLIFTVIFWGHFTCCYFMSNGKSPGKVLFGLQVYSDLDRSLGLRDCLLRTMGYYLCYLPLCLPFIIPFLRSDERGLPDWPSRTHVSWAREASSLREENQDKAHYKLPSAS